MKSFARRGWDFLCLGEREGLGFGRETGAYLRIPLLFLCFLPLIVLSPTVHGMGITYGPLACPQGPAAGEFPTSVKIIWWTDTATAGNTAYVSPAPGGPWTFSGTDGAWSNRHEALVSGLAGDSKCYTYVSSDGVDSPVFEFRTGRNELENGSFETWHPVYGAGWGTEEPDGWHGWEIFPWQPPGGDDPDHITIQMDRMTGLPFPLVKDGLHRVGMDEGWRSCYGGIYQEVDGLAPGSYRLSGWVAWLIQDLDYPNEERVEILAKDGAHVLGAVPSGNVIFSHDGSASDQYWRYVQGSIECNSGTITVYTNLRSDYWNGAAFVHFDGFWLMAEAQPSIRFSNFTSTRTVTGNNYDVTISYDTDIPATTQLQWGPSTSYGSTTPMDPAEVTHHVIQLTGVTPEPDPYHYRAHATTSSGTDEYSGDRTFEAPLVTITQVTSQVDLRTGTMCTITWRTNYPTATNRLYYRTAGTGGYTEVIEPSDPTPHTEHSIALIGLSLGQEYEYFIRSGGSDIIPTTSPLYNFETPAQPGAQIHIGMAMIGGSIPDGGDDVGPANQIQDMVERDWSLVTISGMPSTSWAKAQPVDPGSGPNVYDWSSLDAKADTIIPGKALLAYQQIWGTYPGWVTLDTARFWQKYGEFVEAMTVYVNQNYGLIYYTFENEPNISRAPDGWNWADWYIHCLQHFYVAVHRANGLTGMENKVIAGNLSGHAAGGFNDLYARGLKNCSDILGYHPYPYDIRDGLMVEELAQIHGIQENYGDGQKKIWVSEGWGSGRSAGFDRSSPLIEPPAQEVENMFLAMVNGWNNVMTPRTNWHPDYLWGMKFFCGNDNWGAMNWRERATPIKDGSGNITGFIVDGYRMTTDIAPYYWNGGMLDFYGNSKDCLIHVFPGDGLVFMNPGFELRSEPPRAHLPHFWETDHDPAPAENYALDDVVFHGGTYSLRLTSDGSTAPGVNQMTVKRAAQGGVSYRTRIWCKTEDLSGLTARFFIRFCDLEGTLKSPEFWATDVTGSSDWQQMEIIAVAPSYTQRIEAGCFIEGSGTAWFDDVTVSMTHQEEVGLVKGYTLDEGQIPVPYCIVRTTTGGHQTVSDANGYYEMHDVPTGTYDFVCRQGGYVPFRAKNQTVVAGKPTFVNFNMGIPKPGLEVTEVLCDRTNVHYGEPPANVTVNVANSMPYPNNISEVNLFVEQNGNDVTEFFVIHPSESNPRVVPASTNEDFLFTLAPKMEAGTGSYDVDAYAFGQEDRPNMLENGGLDDPDWDRHWSLTGGADTMQWSPDEGDYYSFPRSLRGFVYDNDNDYTFNWASNYSAYGAAAVPAYPARNYTVGAYHKDNTTGNVPILLFIEEFYYNGSRWLYNGRRFAAVPHRETWAHDVIMYDTGDPNVTQGLYTTNRLLISCGPATTPPGGSGTTWWDDLYVKETGDWLADDRAEAAATLIVGATSVPMWYIY